PAHQCRIHWWRSRPRPLFKVFQLVQSVFDVLGIARLMVDDTDHSMTPLGEGIPDPLGMSAAFRLLANALKTASISWWVLPPLSRSMCSVIRLFMLSALKNSGTSSVSNVPTFSLENSAWKFR